MKTILDNISTRSLMIKTTLLQGIMLVTASLNTHAFLTDDEFRNLSVPAQEVATNEMVELSKVDGPCEISSLDGHSEATVLLLTCQKEKRIIKVFGASYTSDQIERAYQSVLAASRLSVAPHVIKAYPQKRSIVLEYVSGNHLRKPFQNQAKNDPETLKQVAKTIRTVHTIQENPRTYTVFDSIQELYNSILTKKASFPDRMKEVLEGISEAKGLLDSNSELVFSHGDLTPANTYVISDGIRFVDWDEARVTYRYEDLSSLSYHLKMSDDEQLDFLKSYLDRTPSENELAQLYILRRVALVKAALWSFNRPYWDGVEKETLLSTTDLNQRLEDPDFQNYNEYTHPNDRKLSYLETQEFATRSIKQFIYDLNSHEYKRCVQILKLKKRE